MDMKLFVLEKLFVAFSEIVLEVVKLADFEDGTKAVLTSSIESISAVLTSINSANNKGNTPSDITSDSHQARRASKRPNPEQNSTGRAKIGRSESSSTVAVQPNLLALAPRHIAPPSATVSADFELRAIAPAKKVFLTNFPAVISTNEIHAHLKKKVPEIDINLQQIEKLVFKSERAYSSFIINTGEDMDLFQKVVDSEIWPTHTIVHEHKPPRQRTNFRQTGGRQRRT